MLEVESTGHCGRTTTGSGRNGSTLSPCMAIFSTMFARSLASVKSRLVLLFWYRLTRVVPDKGPLNVCVLNVCVFARGETDEHNFLGHSPGGCTIDEATVAEVDGNISFCGYQGDIWLCYSRCPLRGLCNGRVSVSPVGRHLPFATTRASVGSTLGPGGGSQAPKSWLAPPPNCG